MDSSDTSSCDATKTAQQQQWRRRWQWSDTIESIDWPLSAIEKQRLKLCEQLISGDCAADDEKALKTVRSILKKHLQQPPIVLCSALCACFTRNLDGAKLGLPPKDHDIVFNKHIALNLARSYQDVDRTRIFAALALELAQAPVAAYGALAYVVCLQQAKALYELEREACTDDAVLSIHGCAQLPRAWASKLTSRSKMPFYPRLQQQFYYSIVHRLHAALQPVESLHTQQVLLDDLEVLNKELYHHRQVWQVEEQRCLLEHFFNQHFAAVPLTVEADNSIDIASRYAQQQLLAQRAAISRAAAAQRLSAPTTNEQPVFYLDFAREIPSLIVLLFAYKLPPIQHRLQYVKLVLRHGGAPVSTHANDAGRAKMQTVTVTVDGEQIDLLSYCPELIKQYAADKVDPEQAQNSMCLRALARLLKPDSNQPTLMEYLVAQGYGAGLLRMLRSDFADDDFTTLLRELNNQHFTAYSGHGVSDRHYFLEVVYDDFELMVGELHSILAHVELKHLKLNVVSILPYVCGLPNLTIDRLSLNPSWEQNLEQTKVAQATQEQQSAPATAPALTADAATATATASESAPTTSTTAAPSSSTTTATQTTPTGKKRLSLRKRTKASN